MDVRRQVALGAVFGAAVAVNAALQSLHDSGSFLIHNPTSFNSFAMPSHSRKRRAVTSESPAGKTSSQDDGTSEVNDSEEEELFNPFSATTTAVDSQASFADYLPVLGTDRSDSYRGQKLQVRRKNLVASPEDGEKPVCYLRGSDEECSSMEDANAEWEQPSSLLEVKSKKRLQEAMFMPLMPQIDQSEETMSAMLQHTTNTVLSTLADVKERREGMLENMERVNLPEEQASLQLVNRFIDALVNVSDSLKIVHSALFEV